MLILENPADEFVVDISPIDDPVLVSNTTARICPSSIDEVAVVVVEGGKLFKSFTRVGSSTAEVILHPRIEFSTTTLATFLTNPK